MTDLLLPAPSSINSLECDCKWVRRPMGGLVIQLDIPRDAVSVVCNVKSTRRHTSVNMTPWESKAQYRRWNKDTYKPHGQASHLIDQFHAAERKARSICQSRCLSLHRVARIGWVHPSRRNGPHQEHLVGHHNPQEEGDALMPGDLQRPEDSWEAHQKMVEQNYQNSLLDSLETPQPMKRHFVTLVELLQRQT